MMLNVIVFGQCSMNCCQWGSLTRTGRDKETDGSRLCGLLWLWPDCTALFTVGGVCVFMCAAVCTPAQANAFVSWQRKRETQLDAETIHTQPSAHSLSRVPADGFPHSINRRANTLMALHAAIPDTKQYWNLTTVSFIFVITFGV